MNNFFNKKNNTPQPKKFITLVGRARQEHSFQPSFTQVPAKPLIKDEDGYVRLG